MKYLKIENNKGYYQKPSEQAESWIEIDKINKDDLLALLDYAIKGDFEMDAYSEDLMAHKAHQIIYKSMHEKFTNLLATADQFKDESGNLYKDAILKYSNNEAIVQTIEL